LSIPQNAISANGPESLQQYAKAEVDKLAAKYKKNSGRMELYKMVQHSLA
jgi:hypothetical protein